MMKSLKKSKLNQLPGSLCLLVVLLITVSCKTGQNSKKSAVLVKRQHSKGWHFQGFEKRVKQRDYCSNRKTAGSQYIREDKTNIEKVSVSFLSKSEMNRYNFSLTKDYSEKIKPEKTTEPSGQRIINKLPRNVVTKPFLNNFSKAKERKQKDEKLEWYVWVLLGGAAFLLLLFVVLWLVVFFLIVSSI